MAKSVNKVFLLGNVGKDPEIRSTGGGTMVANLTLATSDRQDPQGNWQDRTEWHNLVAFKRTAEIIRDYVKKGSKLYVEGKIQTRSWDDKETGAKFIAPKSLSTIFRCSPAATTAGSSSGGYSRQSGSSFDSQLRPAPSRRPDDYGSPPKSPTTIYRSRIDARHDKAHLAGWALSLRRMA